LQENAATKIQLLEEQVSQLKKDNRTLMSAASRLRPEAPSRPAAVTVKGALSAASSVGVAVTAASESALASQQQAAAGHQQALKTPDPGFLL